MKISKKNPVIAWWSGGVTSAIACKLAIDKYGKDNVRVVFIDTMNEDKDTYSFKIDCEYWYGEKIETIKNPEYNSIQDVWKKYKALNNANGAICSSELKRKTRQIFQRENKFSHQVFGFELGEENRAKSMQLNYPDTFPVFPLLENKLDKKACLKFLLEKNINPPRTYLLGYHNNNCFNTGCVQGGVGYWQKIQREDVGKFNDMADMEHYLTNLKGKPVTMLKYKNKTGEGLVFLKAHALYPEIKDISMMKGREPKPLMECNGFCGINDLSKRSETEKEINFSE